MAKVTQGLRDLAKRDLLPEAQYVLRVNKVSLTADKTGETADCIVVKGPDRETHGKHVNLYLQNFPAELSIGLTQLMASLQVTEVPSGEYGESDTHNFIGAEFPANIVIQPDKKTGQDRNYVNPIYDAEWLNKVLSGEITGEAPKGGKAKAKGRK